MNTLAIREWTFALVVVLGTIAITVSRATPATVASTEQYTGCWMNPTVSYVAIGKSPSKACPKSATYVTWRQKGPRVPIDYTWTATLMREGRYVSGGISVPTGMEAIYVSVTITGDCGTGKEGLWISDHLN